MATTPDLPSAKDFARLEGELFDRITVRHRTRVRRHRVIALAAVVVIAGAGVAAGTVGNSNQQSTFAYCYSGSNTTSRVAALALPTGVTSAVEPGRATTGSRVANALFICSAGWRGGLFSTTSSTGPFPVPKLQVCLRDDLIISVFRKPKGSHSAEDFCSDLGLSAP